MNHGKAVDNTLGGCIPTGGIKTEFEIIQNRQELFEQAGIGKPDGLFLLPDHPLAVILKIRRRSHGLIAITVNLRLKIGRRGCRDGFCLLGVFGGHAPGHRCRVCFRV